MDKQIPAHKINLTSPGLLGRLKKAGKQIKNYAKARPTTTGDSFTPNKVSGILRGAITGFISAGMVGLSGGVTGGWVGVKVGEQTGSFSKALLAGAAAGAVTSVLLASLIGGPPGIAAVVGSLAGLSGTLGGSRRAVTGDSLYGGLILGSALQLPLGALAGSAAAGLAARAVTPKGRAVLGLITGSLIGAGLGMVGGPGAALSSALKGALVGALGSTLGPAVRQIQRNVVEDGLNKLYPLIDKKIGQKPLSLKSRIALGAVAGAIPLALLGSIFHPLGRVIGTVIGGTIGVLGVIRQNRKT